MLKKTNMRIFDDKRNMVIGKNKGFTLIEMMMVVILIGILAGGMLVNSGSQATKTKYAQAEKDLDSILLAMSTAYSEVGTFGTVTTGKTLDAAFAGTFKTAFEKKFARPLSEAKDPWDNAYYVTSTYTESTGAGKIEIICSASSTTPGTAKTNPYNGNKAVKRIAYNE